MNKETAIMPEFRGVGQWLWKIGSVENAIGKEYTHKEFINRLHSLGTDWLAYKTTDSSVLYQHNCEVLPGLQSVIAEEGIKLYGWGYTYAGYWGVSRDKRYKSPVPFKRDGKVWFANVVGEAEIIVKAVEQFKLPGFILDVEMEVRDVGPHIGGYISVFLDLLQKGLGKDYPLAFCSFRYPEMHKGIPYHQYLKYAKYNMPQVYWEEAHNPGAQLLLSRSQYRAINPNSYFVPVGSSYRVRGWMSTREDIIAFSQMANNMELQGMSWWSYDENGGPMTTPYMHEAMRAAFDAYWENDPEPIPDPEELEPTPERKIELLWEDYLKRNPYP